ncbi:hypothetical protein DA482_01740 [Pseudomonas fluorescens]|nr:hypothetical protein D0N73_09950 [Pseudomonas fluorescens]TWR46978.1 hypothetical protein FIP59_15065 [Pseudomonas fluorescens]
MQPHCTSLQNFAICETADRPQSAPARLGCRFVCTTSGFAQKKDANPVGGRGISGFHLNFFLHERFLHHRTGYSRTTVNLPHHTHVPCRRTGLSPLPMIITARRLPRRTWLCWTGALQGIVR